MNQVIGLQLLKPSLFCCLCSCLLAFASVTLAQDDRSQASDLISDVLEIAQGTSAEQLLPKQEFPTQLEQIYAEDRFNKEKAFVCYNSRLKWLNFIKPCKSTFDFDFEENDKGVNLGWLPLLFEVLAWIFVVVLVAVFAFYLFRHLKGTDIRLRKRLDKEELPEYLKAVVDEDYTSLRANIDALLAKGLLRQAAALLYRACIAQLLVRGMRVKRTNTELEILRIAKRVLLENEPSYSAQEQIGSLNLSVSFQTVNDITQIWRRIAYRHDMIQPADIVSLLGRYEETIESLSPDLLLDEQIVKSAAPANMVRA